MKRILSILPWVAALLVIRAIKIKKINRELKTLEQLEEKNIDENNYSIQENDMIPSSRTQKYKNLLGGILCPEKVKLMQ